MPADFFVWLSQQPQGTASFIGTLAGSTLGFLALLAGALFNAHLNRRRDDRQRRHDRTALATALCAELQLTREILLSNTDVLRNPPTGVDDGFFVPLPVVKFLPALTDRIGLLSSDAIKAALSAYLVIEQTGSELAMLGGRRLNNPDNNQLWVPATCAPHVLRTNTAKSDYIISALTALAPYREE